MSSTTDARSQGLRRGERGQALVIFAIILVGLGLVAALAVDVGMIMLERRHEQNAADAAALAGARYLPDAGAARAQARSVAAVNGYTQGADDVTVTVGATSTRVLVTIHKSIPSFFAGLAGIASWPVSASATAISLQDQPPFAALTALNPHACEALKISGSGMISSAGDIQVNSDCPTDALLISGQGNLQLQHDGLACWVVGGYQISGKGQGKYCDPPQPGVPIDFPINDMPDNEVAPPPPSQIAGAVSPVPDGCPGTPGYLDAKTCQFNSSYKDTIWRLYPGYYPGGIKIQSGGTFCLEPGIYHLAGGGFTVTGNGAVAVSVDAGRCPTALGTIPTLGGGVLFFNTTHPAAAAGPIQMGGNGGLFNFWPLGGIDESCSGESEGWNRYLVFQDPAVTNPLIINGGTNDMEARGLILAPTAKVQINGGSGDLTIDAVSADTYLINGNGGNIFVLYDNCALPTYTGYGLVV